MSNEFSKRVGALMRDGNVAWELQKRARQTRNKNTRYYNFWRFANSLVFEDILVAGTKLYKLAKKIEATASFDQDGEIKKLEKYAAILANLDKDDKDTKLQATRKKLIEQIETATINIVSAKTNQAWETTKKVFDIIDFVIADGSPMLHKAIKKYLDYAESRHELQVKRIETQAADLVTTEDYEMVKEILRSGKETVDWNEVSKIDGKAEVLKSTLDYREKYLKNVSGFNWTFFSDGVSKLPSQQVNEDIKKIKTKIKNLKSLLEIERQEEKITVQKKKKMKQD